MANDRPQEQANKPAEPKKDKICIFEKRYCRYAEREGSSFQCTAPSDEEMTCRK